MKNLPNQTQVFNNEEPTKQTHVFNYQEPYKPNLPVQTMKDPPNPINGISKARSRKAVHEVSDIPTRILSTWSPKCRQEKAVHEVSDIPTRILSKWSPKCRQEKAVHEISDIPTRILSTWSQKCRPEKVVREVPDIPTRISPHKMISEFLCVVICVWKTICPYHLKS